MDQTGCMLIYQKFSCRKPIVRQDSSRSYWGQKFWLCRLRVGGNVVDPVYTGWAKKTGLFLTVNNFFCA